MDKDLLEVIIHRDRRGMFLNYELIHQVIISIQDRTRFKRKSQITVS